MRFTEIANPNLVPEMPCPGCGGPMGKTFLACWACWEEDSQHKGVVDGIDSALRVYNEGQLQRLVALGSVEAEAELLLRWAGAS